MDRLLIEPDECGFLPAIVRAGSIIGRSYGGLFIGFQSVIVEGQAFAGHSLGTGERFGKSVK